jgi:hypothetical protein
MANERVRLPLPAGVTAERATASGRKGATRWELYRGEHTYENWLGDLVRAMPENEWSWQPRAGADVFGTYDEAVAAMKEGVTRGL